MNKKLKIIVIVGLCLSTILITSGIIYYKTHENKSVQEDNKQIEAIKDDLSKDDASGISKQLLSSNKSVMITILQKLQIEKQNGVENPEYTVDGITYKLSEDGSYIYKDVDDVRYVYDLNADKWQEYKKLNNPDIKTLSEQDSEALIKNSGKVTNYANYKIYENRTITDEMNSAYNLIMDKYSSVKQNRGVDYIQFENKSVVVILFDMDYKPLVFYYNGDIQPLSITPETITQITGQKIDLVTSE